MLRPIIVFPVAAVLAATAFFIGPATTRPAQNVGVLPVSYYLAEHAARAQENPLGDHAVYVLSSLGESSDGSPMIQAVAPATLIQDGAR